MGDRLRIESCSLSGVLRDWMDRNDLTVMLASNRLGMSHQALRNLLKGGSTNHRVIKRIINEVDASDELIRSILISYLRLLIEDDALIIRAGLVDS